MSETRRTISRYLVPVVAAFTIGTVTGAALTAQPNARKSPAPPSEHRPTRPRSPGTPKDKRRVVMGVGSLITDAPILHVKPSSDSQRSKFTFSPDTAYAGSGPDPDDLVTIYSPALSDRLLTAAHISESDDKYDRAGLLLTSFGGGVITESIVVYDGSLSIDDIEEETALRKGLHPLYGKGFASARSVGFELSAEAIPIRSINRSELEVVVSGVPTSGGA